METKDTDWLYVDPSEMAAIIAQLEIEMEEEMKSNHPDTGFRSLYNPRTGEVWEPRPFRVHGSSRRRRRPAMWVALLLLIFGVFGLCVLIAEILQ